MSRKRSAKEQIEFYRERLKEVQECERKKRRRILISDSSDSETESLNQFELATEQNYTPLNEQGNVQTETNMGLKDQAEADPKLTTEGDIDASFPPLDTDVLVALGDAVLEEPQYGPKIHQDLAQRWIPILRKGLTKEAKESVTKEVAVPENCKMLRAPSMNPEIAAALPEACRSRDKKLEGCQQQLGLGITAMNTAMTFLLTSDSKLQALKHLSDACRILTDLHYQETQVRVKLASNCLDKQFLNVIQDSERDETLFGNNLAEKIKASKAIEKQGAQIKKPEARVGSYRTPRASTSRDSRYQGNQRAPSRSSTRGGRGGARKPSAPRRGHLQYYSSGQRQWNKPQRAHNPPQ